MATAPKKAYGILHITSAKFLHTFKEDNDTELLKFATKELAEFYITSITRVGLRIKHDTKITPALLLHLNIFDDDDFVDSVKKPHNHCQTVLNGEYLKRFTESMIKMQKFCESIECLNIPDSVIFATFNTATGDNDSDGSYSATYNAFPDFNPCCELYEKSHFEVVEVPNKIDTPFIVNPDNTAKLLLKLFSQAKNGGISGELVEKLKKEVGIKSVTVT